MKDWIDEAANTLVQITNSTRERQVVFAQIIREAYQKHKTENFQAWCNEQAESIKRQFEPKHTGDNRAAPLSTGEPQAASAQPVPLLPAGIEPAGFVSETGEPIFLGSDLGLKTRPWVCFRQDGSTEYGPR